MLSTLQLLLVLDLYAFRMHPIRRHSIQPIILWCNTWAYLDTIQVRPCYLLWHGVRRIDNLEWLPWHHVPNASTYWPYRVFCGFSKLKVRLYVHGVHLAFNFHHPFLPTRTHKFLHFPLRHESIMTTRGSDTNNTGNDSFLVDTISYSFAFHVNLQYGLVWLLAWFFDYLKSGILWL